MEDSENLCPNDSSSCLQTVLANRQEDVYTHAAKNEIFTRRKEHFTRENTVFHMITAIKCNQMDSS